MIKISKRIIIVLIMFGALFPVSFTFLPSFLSSRVIVALLGTVFFVLSRKNKNKYFYRNIKVLLIISILIATWSIICTVIINQGYDYTYVKHPFTILIMFFAAYATVATINLQYGISTYELVTKYFLYAVLLQSMFVVIQFFNSDIANLISSIQRLTERQINISNYHLNSGTRFIGFGLMFYTASFFYGTSLILLAFRLRYKVLNKREVLLNSLFYLFIFFIGMGLSRSTIIGFVSSLFVFIFPIRNIINTFKYLILSGVFVLVMILIIKNPYFLTQSFDLLIENSFDFVLSYINTGNFESDSASGTFDFLVFPRELKTYIVGTGLYETYHSIGDYNYSDIGYLRLLYYFGIPGVILFFWFEIKLLNLSFKRKGFAPIYYSLLFLLLILNIKGLATLSIISFLYLMVSNKHTNLTK